MRKLINILCVLLLGAAVLACGGGRGNSPAAGPSTRAFPRVTIPSMYDAPAERAEYAAVHFWDAFLDTAAVHPGDTAILSGVPLPEVEGMMASYCTLLQDLPLSAGVSAVARYAALLEDFGERSDGGPVREKMIALTEKYLYDPNSPLRDEDLYRPFAAALAESRLTPENRRAGYRHEAALCALNARGTRAADFSFLDTEGRRRTLYGIRAQQTLLIFGNPDCQGCQEILARLSADPRISERIRSGTLKVVDVYIDEDIARWKEGISSYPKEWTNGYDPAHLIREDRLYHVRALPSLYLLDADKTVLLKDAPEERLLSCLTRL